MDLSVIIVSWNVRERLRDNLRSIYQTNGLQFEVFVVDNDSADNTAEMVQQEFPQVKLIANQQNYGFAKANNQAIEQAQGSVVLLLNPDTKVFPDTFYNLLKWLKYNPQASLAGCKLVSETGEIIKHVRRFPRFADQLAIVMKLPHLFPGILKKYLREDFNYDKSAKVDSVRGGFFAVRKETIEQIGLLDERFFVWFEEVDYCKRVKEAGGEVWYIPDVKCIDYVGQSFSQVKRGTTQKYFKDSMLKYFKKWHPAWQYRILLLAWPIGQLLTSVGEKINFKRRANT